VGIKERQEREREATTRSILDAARELFVAEGYRNVSIRKIAEKIEYSPAAIYSYFPSKDDIFLALAEEGFRLLFESHETCALRTDPSSSPLDCVRAAFLNVYTFSKTHPEYHGLMFLERSVPKISQDWQRFEFVREMRTHLTTQIRTAIGRGDFPANTDPELVFRVLMVSTLGVCMVRVCDRMTPGEDADALARVTIEAALTGFRTGFANAYAPDNGQ
jgi:AcrR family transcriptional regulator